MTFRLNVLDHTPSRKINTCPVANGEKTTESFLKYSLYKIRAVATRFGKINYPPGVARSWREPFNINADMFGAANVPLGYSRLPFFPQTDREWSQWLSEALNRPYILAWLFHHDLNAAGVSHPGGDR